MFAKYMCNMFLVVCLFTEPIRAVLNFVFENDVILTLLVEFVC